MIVKYTCASQGVLPTFNSGYTEYNVNEVNNGNETWTTTITKTGNSMPNIISFKDKSTLLSIEKIDTSNVTNMQNMFNGCSSLTQLNVSNFNTSNVTNMSSMFRGCSSLTTLDLSNFNTSNVITMGYMFYNCSSLNELDVSNFDTENVTNMAYMFENCSKLTSLDVSNFDVSNVNNMYSMFNSCSSLTSLDVSNFDTSNVTNMRYMFQHCSKLTSLDLSSFNTSNVTDMQNMFYSCSSLNSLDVSNFNTSNVTNMYRMFYNCSKLTSLDVSNFNTSNATNMYQMFYGCSSLTSLDLSSFDTKNATTMYQIFANCSSLTQLDLSNFDTTNVTDMQEMFNRCSSLTDIGMIYCDSLTVNKLAELLNTQSRNVYVECDISCYDKYQYITYIQYKEDKKVLLYYDAESETWKKPVLREWDTIEKHNDGKYYYHKRSGEVVLNGSEDWIFYDGFDTCTPYVTEILNIKYLHAPISDKFNGDIYNGKDEEKVCVGGSPHIIIQKANLKEDVASFKQWLQQNPTTVVYQLAQEEVYECINIDLLTCQDETNYSVNTGVISPKTTLKVHINITNIITTIQEKVHTLESELNLLRIDKVLLDIQDIINE